MDSLVSLIDQVIPGSPGLAIATAVLLLACGWIARKAAASMRRQGARLGAVEKAVKLERTRRRQVEQCLRERGMPLPYWPDDPPQLYAPYSGPGPWPQDGIPLPYEDDDQGDEFTTELATQHFTRHRLPTRGRNTP
jgi:hypothetical protein